MEDFVISKCDISDTEGIRNVAKANNYFNPEYNKENETGFTGTVYSESTVKKILSHNLSYKISYKGKIVGYILCVKGEKYHEVFGETIKELSKEFFGNTTAIPENIAYGAQAAVLPAFKGRGIARELFSNIETELKNKGYKAIYAEIAGNNKDSINYWRHLGFKKVGSKKIGNYVNFKGCDNEWLQKNYNILLSKQDERVDQKTMEKMTCGLFKYSL